MTTTRPPTYAFGATLVFAMAISAYTQFLLGVLAPLITDDLGLSRTELGSLTTALFVIGSLGAPLVGPLVDVAGGRRMLALIFVVAGASWASMAAAPTYGWLLAAACLAGFVRGASNPVGNQLVSLHAPEHSQGLLMGISKSGAQIGAFLVGITAPTAAGVLGWRGVMLASVGLSLIGLLATFAVIPRDRSRQELRERESSGGHAAKPLLVWLGTHACLMGIGGGSVNAYLPLFAVERLDMTVGRAGVVAGVMALMGIGGRIFWGRQADRFSSPQVPLMLIAGAGAVSLACLAAAAGGHEALLWIGSLGFGLSAGSWIAVGMLTIIREIHVTLAGRTSGWILGLFYGGFACSPLLFGFLVDQTGSYRLAWGTGALAFAASAAVAWRWHANQRRLATVR